MIDQVGRSIPAAVQSWWSWVKLELFKYIVIHSIIAESDGACLLPGSEYNYGYLCQHISLNIDTRNWSSDVLFWFEGWPWDHDSDWAILNGTKNVKYHHGPVCWCWYYQVTGDWCWYPYYSYSSGPFPYFLYLCMVIRWYNYKCLLVTAQILSRQLTKNSDTTTRQKVQGTTTSAQILSKQLTRQDQWHTVTMSGEVEKNLQEKEVVSHSEVFNTVTSTATKRRMVVETVHNPAVSLGMVDPTTGRLL